MKLVTFIALLPGSEFKNKLLRRQGWRIGTGVTVRTILVLNCGPFHLEDGSRIGNLNAFRGLRGLRLGPGATIGQLTWVSSAPGSQPDDPVQAEGETVAGELRIGRQTAVTNRHFIDCSGGVVIGDFSTVAGVRSTMITHGINIYRSRQETAGITIGSRCIVSSNVKIVPGAHVPSHSLVAMGAVVSKGLKDEYQVYAGVPAKAIRELPVDAEYFRRTQGKVFADD